MNSELYCMSEQSPSQLFTEKVLNRMDEFLPIPTVP